MTMSFDSISTNNQPSLTSFLHFQNQLHADHEPDCSKLVLRTDNDLQYASAKFDSAVKKDVWCKAGIHSLSCARAER